MMSLWDALRMNMMISYQELVRTFLRRTYHDVKKELILWFNSIYTQYTSRRRLEYLKAVMNSGRQRLRYFWQRG